MKYIAAFLLAQLGENTDPSQKDISGILAAAGGDVDNDKIDEVLKGANHKNAEEIIASGKEKLSEKIASNVATQVTVEEAPKEEKKEEAPKEEKKEEKKEEEEEEVDGLFGLFD